MRVGWFCLGMILGIGFFAVGCGSLSRNPEVPLVVHVDEQKTLRVHGEPVALDALPKRLEALGAGPRQQIEVHARGEIDREFIAQITSRLAANGYRRLIFVGKRRAVSHVEEPR